MYDNKFLLEDGQPLLYTYGELDNVLIGNYGTLYKLSEKLVDSGLWTSLTKLNDISTYINRIFIYPMYIKTPTYEGNSLKLIGAIDNIYSDVKVAKLYVTPPNRNIGIYTLYDGKIEEKYNDFRDYGAYTKIKIFLPYLGYVDVDTNDVMNKYIKVCLQVDFRTGYGMYYIISQIDDDENLEYRILTKHTVKLAIEVPVGSTSSAEQYRNMVLSAVRVAATVGFAASGMPLSATVTSSNISASTENFSEAKARGDWKGSRMRTVSSTTGTSTSEIIADKTYTHMRGSYSIANDVLQSTISAINGSSSSSHSVESNSPVLEGVGCKYVKIVIERPKYVDVGNYYSLCGRPLQEVRQLDTLNGYTEISSVHLENFIVATYDELSKLESIIKTGIIL